MVRKANVIAIMSPKGGVGKTATSANLAAALAIEFGKKVLLIDTNVSTASLGLHFDIFYPENTLNALLEKGHPIKKAIHIYHNNLHIIPASITIKKEERNVYTARENIRKIIKYYDKLLKDLSKEYDLILLDCAPGLDIESIATLHVAGGLLLVTNPDYPSIITAVKAMEYAKYLKMPVGGVILNKVRNKKYELTKKEIEEALEMKVIQEIPFDNNIPKSIANKIPIVLFRPYSKASIAYKKLAASIVGKKYNYGVKKRIERYLRIGRRRDKKKK
jgi:chromosome partitioning protein